MEVPETEAVTEEHAEPSPTSPRLADTGPPDGRDRSTAAYWKRILGENPELLHDRSGNAGLEKIWLADHPGHTEVPRNIRQNLANVKSQLRKEHRDEQAAEASERRKSRKAAPTNGTPPTPVKPAPVPARVSEGVLQAYEALEIKIDDCLVRARDTDHEGLEQVIHHLRTARNELIRRQAP